MKGAVFLMSSFLSLFGTEKKQSEHPFFQASSGQPYQLSIGAVLFDTRGRIACHHFKEISGQKDIYILMKEDMEDDETPLMTLERGLQEEFGAKVKSIAFLGCLSGYLCDPPLSFEKTTLYIACQLIEWDLEAGSHIEWIEPAELIAIMKKQGIRFQHRVDVDESEIVRRALPYMSFRK